MLLREIFIGGARAPPAPPHATALNKVILFGHVQSLVSLSYEFSAVYCHLTHIVIAMKICSVSLICSGYQK